MQTVSSRLSELSRGDLDTRGLLAETQGLRQDNGWGCGAGCGVGGFDCVCLRE